MGYKQLGIDISKSFFDIAFQRGDSKWSSKRFDYTAKGMSQFCGILPEGCTCIMEATGPYYLKLAYYLYGKGVKVSVVNPLIIRRYSQMKMMRTKTDKADAKVIAQFGKDHQPGLWEPKSPQIRRIKQISSLLEKLTKDRAGWLNKEESAKHDPYYDKQGMKIIEQTISYFDKQIKKLEQELDEVIEANYGGVNDILTSIPGIGRKTAIMLIAITGGFDNFDNYKQLSSYIGLCPRIYESGKSIRGRARICKVGMSRMRQLLYMCAVSAKRYNKACRDLYNRLVEKGKAKKLALIAVANKLLKQVFGCIKNMEMYNPNFC